MKTITVTFHFVHNYGAALQTYALQQAFKKYGIDNKVLNYQYYTPKLFRKIGFSLSKANIKAILDDLTVLKHFRERKQKFDRFEEFVHEYIDLTDVIHKLEELKYINADAFITGSDQVWNLNAGIIKPFDLAFVPADSKRYSYAASMGKVGNWKSEEVLNSFLNELRKYTSISVREKQAQLFLGKMGFKNVEMHIDPVFLLTVTDWEKLVGKPIVKGRYILCYQLLRNSLLPYVLRELKKQTGLPVYGLCEGFSKKYWDKSIYNAGPLEFLNYIYYAEKVVTTSFHGTAFSILFHKDFFSLNNSASPERIANLLEIAGVKSRLITSVDDLVSSLNHKINTADVDERIEKAREKGQDYLLSMVEQD